MRDIQIRRDSHENVSLFDTFDLTLNRDSANNLEIVIHPCAIGSVAVRYAKEPYVCTAILRGGKRRCLDIGDESDWGDIDTTDRAHPKIGNDVDGYKEVVRVMSNDGEEIPLEVFSRDVNDCMIYFEG